MVTGEIEKMMYYTLGNTMGSLRTQTYVRSLCLARSDDLKYVCVRRLYTLWGSDRYSLFYTDKKG